ncbi:MULTISPECIES: formylmethanofuran dehydrogenase subunit C [unclassified Mesorhizobium]|uniref:formylmethanofuran dehydrogenase subunit C n=1 Tax=unclassified Mesorhizobium TaxID=325217 RepID=UPI00112D76FC|nr:MULTISPECIES: formylmethanofuran dehydrogenase subunit C [unclassified Mesorhizobium]MBZ9702677.1 formylmethanofuran dehydrogenase subunit C [Mesorhizobium sp. CO1-1-3]MBZ9948605.1 formylmethanofuran dehydrogenase subunit C [Mesorhizobium sp. BR1-1-11]TPJ09151.1 formylmethanofuran dehydrogenase subunit C [Mesorhizobium sp. B2-8-1]TPK46582.1 formylmethanofuran dehydrogenase subunit C [Mesorhizobium sp. B2-5-2]TPL22042.1 formylmethanofuran dehydrogenase subunit C [Mesorhizobium sp. B2-4-9]
MKALTFTLVAEPPERLDLSPLTPERLAGSERRDIEKIRIGMSKHGSKVGDIFRLAGSDPLSIVFEGGSARLDRVAQGMGGGSVRVIGNTGAQAGRAMRSGKLTIEGNAGPHAGSGMRGGRLEIIGNAGDHLGAPLVGELAGMNGGVLIVRGRAGAFAADRMRRGLISVLKGSGDYAGSRMIAGTLVVAGGIGEMPGYLMRRGSILLDRAPGHLSPSFVECGAPESVFATVIDRHLIAEGILKRPLLGSAPHKYGGDNAVLGMGEVLFPRR